MSLDALACWVVRSGLFVESRYCDLHVLLIVDGTIRWCKDKHLSLTTLDWWIEVNASVRLAGILSHLMVFYTTKN